MLRTVHLHGRLGKRFGRTHTLDVTSPAEAIHALCTIKPGFRKYITPRRYAVVAGDDTPVTVDTMSLGLGKKTDLHIVPAGAAAGLEAILLLGLTLVTAALAVVTLVMMPRAPLPGDREEATRTDSYIYDGAQNSTEQGHPVALVYGRMRTGSLVVSAGISTTDVNEASVSAATGYVGSSPGIRGSAYGDEFEVVLSKGGKGGSGGSTRSAQEDPNTLQSQAVARIVDLISEGEIVGLVDGLKSVYFDDTPLQAPDGSFNFSGVAIEQRFGLPDQDYMPGYGQTENTISVNTDVKILTGPVTRTIIDADTDVARVTLGLPRLSQQDTTNGDLKSTSVTVAIELQSNGGGYSEVVRHTFTGKSNGPYQRSFDIRLPAGGAPHDIRVKRISPDSALASLSNETRWELLTEIVEAKLTYPDSALIGLTVDARQFGSNIPTRSYDIKGIIVELPTNYDPATRSYATTGPGTTGGVWDGTFKRAWTDNPAWVYRDINVNDRYGLGRRVGASRVDKWTLYEIARWCDEDVPDGFGGTEPRYTINCAITSAVAAYDLLASIASTFRGWAYWGSGASLVVADKDEDPTLLVSEANVEGGVFEYDRITPLDKRRSVVLVQWNDPADGYRLATEVIEDPDLVRRFGWEPRQTVVAFGATRRGQAVRIGKFILEDEGPGNAGVQYRSGDDHGFVEPGRIISIADRTFSNARRGGRIKAGSTTTLIKLDAPVTLDQPRIYTLRVLLPNGTVEDRAVSYGATGDYGELTITPALSIVPLPGAVWTLESSDVVNRRWRVRSIENEKPPYKIRATLHDPTKYPRVEEGLSITPDNYLDLPSGGLKPPTGIEVQEFMQQRGDSYVPAAQVAWQASPDPRVLFYQAQHKPPGGSWDAFADSPELSRPIANITPGSHSVRVRAVDSLGRKTAWMVKTFVLGGQVGALPTVTGLSVQVDDDTLATALAWNKPNDTRPLRYEVLWAATNSFGSAVSLGFTSALEFPAANLGHYWVRTEYAGTKASAQAYIEVTAATVPSPRYTNVQGAPRSLADLDAAAAASLTAAQQDIAELFTTYGSTASAAASAAAAETARSNAVSAATAAGGYASTAQTYRDEAAGSVTTAQGWATTAGTHASNASVSAGNAATSATNSAGSASSAATSAAVAASYSNAYLNRNPDFTSDLVGWFTDFGSEFGTVPGSWVASGNGRSGLWSGAGYFYGYGNYIPVAGNEKLELSASYYVSTEAAAENAVYHLGLVPYDAAKNSLTGGSAWYFLRSAHQSPNGWNNVSTIGDLAANYPSARFVRVIALFNYPTGGPATSGVTQVDYVRLRDVTTSEAAAASASAAATSASSAGVSATNAGVSASSANTSATNASVSEGNAATSAGTASTQASVATAAASAAQISASLSASINTGSINPNPNFMDWPVGQALPTNWAVWADNGVTRRTTADSIHPIVEMTSVTAQTVSIQQAYDTPGLTRITDAYYVLELDAQAWAGPGWLGTGFGLWCYDEINNFLGGAYIDCGNESLPDGSTPPWDYRFINKWRKLVQPPAGTRKAILYLFHNYPAAFGGGTGTRTVRYHRAAVRAATQAEVQNQTVLPGLVSASATHTEQISVLASTDTSQASSISSLTARMGAAEGNITTEQTVTATQTAQIATISARYSVTLDVNGHVSGFSLLGTGDGSSEFIVKASTFKIALPGYGSRTLFAVSADKVQFGTDLYAGAYKLVFDNGSVMKVLGTGFGSANQFVSWFGPSMAVSSCTEANGTTWEKVNGDAYFGGSLSAGILKTAVQTSSLASDASIETADYGSNGGTIQIVVNYLHTSTIEGSYSADIAGVNAYDADVAAYGGSGSPSNFAGSRAESGTATVTLDRATGGGSYTNGVATLNLSGGTSTFTGIKPTPGDSAGYYSITYNYGTSITYTDPANSTTNRRYRARLTARSVSMGYMNVQQRVGIVSTEG